MEVAGVILIAFGILILRQINVNHRVQFLLKGTLFRNHRNVTLLVTLCFFLFFVGPLMLRFLPLSWRIAIALFLIILLVIDVKKRSEKSIARKIIRIYKNIKSRLPEPNEQQALRDTLAAYLKTIGTDDSSATAYIRGVFETEDPDYFKKMLMAMNEAGLDVSLHLSGLINLILNYHDDIYWYYNSLELSDIRDKNISIALLEENILK